MGTKYASNVTVVVDGFKMEAVYDVTLDHGTYHDTTTFESDAIYRTQQANVRARLTATDGTKLEFRVEGYEQVGRELYFYGPLRSLFPEMFVDIDPLPWQVAYLASMARPSIDRFKLRRTDDYFTGDRAISFRLGYEAGTKNGAETERKLARIAAEGLKNPPKTKHNGLTAAEAVESFGKATDAAVKQVGAIQEAFAKRRG